ncbi:hypothetical protein QTP70_016497 [Hemibagrus guttatus]|uniref:non-specific serine/threonine protein kinase n=1 Tax=Hemibagrus guttatus TaxID=175788 RepID=A0AAE0UHJ5_9TELE|nr:hypothetical protein QTP70_016497 [Hemibagrus guttatus]
MCQMDKKMQSNPAVQTPHHEIENGILKGDDSYLHDGGKNPFPGPLMSSKIQMDDVLRFIQRKSQECLQQVGQPDQKEAYLFWKIMELRCSKNGEALLAEVATVLLKNYSLLRKRLGKKNQDSWYLPLAKLLCSAKPDEEILDAVVQMGTNLDSIGLTYAAHLCYVTAMEELGILQHSSFDLIGCNRASQPNFQIYKCFHASKLDEFGLFDQAFQYCKTIATAIDIFPQEITKTTVEMAIALSERLHQGMGEEPEWLQNLRLLYMDEEYQQENATCGLVALQHPRQEGPHYTMGVFLLRRHKEGGKSVFESLYTPGELLGQGGFGSVCAGVRNADGKQVAIKYVGKEANEGFITIPGETESLPLEVALMQMVSKPNRHENVLELFEWFEMPDCYILILERPSPCKDLKQFKVDNNGWLLEPLAQHIMRQVVQAARHCSDCGVLHRDIKEENILINTDTLQLKLIDFGCGDLLQDTPFRYYAGTRAYIPPEWLCEGEYFGDPATVWSLGVLLFGLVCGYLPFQCDGDIINRNMHFPEGLSEGCRDLILWCLTRHPPSRPTFEEILSHKWFEEPQKNIQNPANTETPAPQCPLLESHITPWEAFDSLYNTYMLLGAGGYGKVFAAIRNADGKQVAVKHVPKNPGNKFITIPGDTRSLPLEVALMGNGFQATSAENLLINPDTLHVNLIDFGCGDLLTHKPYTEYEGTWSFSPPEWVCDGEYLGRPATMWSLGVLLFYLVCGRLPFFNEDDIVYKKMYFSPGLSEACHNLINWCMDLDPESRPTFEEVLSHEWFTSGGSE